MGWSFRLHHPPGAAVLTMAHLAQATVTRLLEAARSGDRAAFEQLFPLIYDEVRKRAHQQRQQWHGDYTLNTTALVHEAYLKLVDQDQADWASRAHFLAVAARVMRHILLDYAKSRRTQKRGGKAPKISLDVVQAVGEHELVLSEERAEALITLDEALQRLQQIDERQSRIVECRFYGSMTIKETAEALNISPATVTRDWAVAQAWLYQEMTDSPA